MKGSNAMSKEKKIQTEESGSGSDLKRVLGYAENMKGMCVVSWLLSMLSSLLSLVPYWCIWQIFKNVMDEKEIFHEHLCMDGQQLFLQCYLLCFTYCP